MSRRLVDGKKPKPRKGANKGGRPLLAGSLLESDPKLIEKVLALLRIGSHIEVAAAVNGIGYSTLREWVLKGKENPDSLYGAFTRAVEKGVSEAETRDLNTIDQHANGRDAIFEYEPILTPVTDEKGNVVFDSRNQPLMKPLLDREGKPMMQIARDGEGRPIVKRSEIRPDWKAAAWKLERRNPGRWGRFDRLQVDEVLRIDRQATEKEVVSPEQRQEKLLELQQKMRNLEALDDDEWSK